METKYLHHTFMGSYTANRWIEMILSGEIELPEYQRSFSWDWEENGKLFYDTLRNYGYIPPITIGQYNKKLYLIDGQQRLTTLLCLKHKIWPIKEDSQKKTADIEEEEEFFAKFDFREIQEIIKTKNQNIDWKQELIGKKRVEDISSLKLETLNFDDIHIPYNYITWAKGVSPKKQAEFYAKTFKTINTGGKALIRREIREAIYWFYTGIKEKVNNKEFESKIKINNEPLDFIEYLSLALSSQDYAFKGRRYARDNKDKLEQYIIDFIEYLTQSDKHLGIWAKEMKECITPKNYMLFRKEFDKLDVTVFSSLIDADYYLLGLIYHVYNGSKIDDIKIDKLKFDLNSKIDETKSNKETSHVRQRNAKKYIQQRLETSKKIWKDSMVKREDNA